MKKENRLSRLPRGPQRGMASKESYDVSDPHG